jgi:hypothetical protein
MHAALEVQRPVLWSGKITSIKFNENQLSSSQIATCRAMDKNSEANMHFFINFS